MKYYLIEISTHNLNHRIRSRAEGKNISDATFFFRSIADGVTLHQVPIFDFFRLESFDKEEYWESQLDDVYNFIGKGSEIPGWLISEKLKYLLSEYKITPHNFYPSKLLYRKSKLDYYIFQYTGKSRVEAIREVIDFSKSIFVDPNGAQLVIRSKDDFVKEKKRILNETNDYDKRIKLQSLVLKYELDFFPMQSFMVDNIVSERLKESILSNNISGFQFKELEYSVLVEEGFGG